MLKSTSHNICRISCRFLCWLCRECDHTFANRNISYKLVSALSINSESLLVNLVDGVLFVMVRKLSWFIVEIMKDSGIDLNPELLQGGSPNNTIMFLFMLTLINLRFLTVPKRNIYRAVLSTIKFYNMALVEILI